MTSLRDFARFLAVLTLILATAVALVVAGQTWRCATAYGTELAFCAEGVER